MEDLTVYQVLFLHYCLSILINFAWETVGDCESDACCTEHAFKESASVLVGVAHLAIKLLLDCTSLVMLVNDTGLIHAHSLP